MKNKKNFILRIDSETYRVLEKWAADEFRSVNGQIEFLLHQAMIGAGRKGSSPKQVEKSRSRKDNNPC